MAKKVYAVRKGRKTGIFATWPECQKQIMGFSGAEYKSFPTREEAQSFIDGGMGGEAIPETEAVAYVDGSYNGATGQFSCGVVLFHRGEEKHFSIPYEDQELAEMRNVAGEIKGAETAMEYCLAHHIPSLTIYHDYEGIAKWCTGAWQAKKTGTQKYREFYEKAKAQMDIYFIKVKGHSGDKYNDLADELAKAAINL